jgi:cell division protein FtsW
VAQYDFFLLGVVSILVGLGLVMIFSASFAQSNQFFDRPTYYFLRQLQWLVVSVVVMLGIALVDFRVLKRWALVIMIGTVLLLLVVLVFGHDNLGARRHLFNNSVQPSEVAKLTIIIYIAYWLSSKGSRLKEVSYGLVPFAVLLGLVALLVVLQPDFDTTGLIVITALIMFFVAGADLKQLALFALIATVTFVFAVMQIDYAAKRIHEFMSFLQDPLNGSAQMTAGLTALANGGLLAPAWVMVETSCTCLLPTAFSPWWAKSWDWSAPWAWFSSF